MKLFVVAVFYMCGIFSAIYCIQRTTFANVGECFSDGSTPEAWEKPRPIWKIMEIGSSNVRAHMYDDGRWLLGDGSLAKSTLHSFDRVPCPN